jgi:hypothetical protein
MNNQLTRAVVVVVVTIVQHFSNCDTQTEVTHHTLILLSTVVPQLTHVIAKTVKLHSITSALVI